MHNASRKVRATLLLVLLCVGLLASTGGAAAVSEVTAASNQCPIEYCWEHHDPPEHPDGEHIDYDELVELWERVVKDDS